MFGGSRQSVLVLWRMGLRILWCMMLSFINVSNGLPRSNNTYVRAIRWAHKMHHKHLDKQQGESFGMLYVHKKYWEKIQRDKKLMAGNKKVEYAPETE